MKQAQATYSMCIYAINIARIRQNSRKVSVPPTVHVLQIGLAESSSCERIVSGFEFPNSFISDISCYSHCVIELGYYFIPSFCKTEWEGRWPEGG